ncbi:hypothetical protein H8356DRAFT_1359028 [Neocallimastix lanati (nom. inval.)]|nr:hypothetical protein H8356DRAFT_1359028 [Neocallimastix sp. JGI-2020a]
MLWSICHVIPGDCGCKTQFSNYTWSNYKGSSNKPLCVYRCAAGEKSCYGHERLNGWCNSRTFTSKTED